MRYTNQINSCRYTVLHFGHCYADLWIRTVWEITDRSRNTQKWYDKATSTLATLTTANLGCRKARDILLMGNLNHSSWRHKQPNLYQSGNTVMGLCGAGGAGGGCFGCQDRVKTSEGIKKRGKKVKIWVVYEVIKIPAVNGLWKCPLNSKRGVSLLLLTDLIAW